MKTVREHINDLLKAKGYVHTEERAETYKCKPYTKESIRYKKPTPDPLGESEYTYTVKEEVIDPISDAELASIFAIEQQKTLDALQQTVNSSQEYQAKEMKTLSESVNVIKTIMLAFAVLTAINVVIAVIFMSQIASVFS